MKCNNCGEEISLNSNFCTSCGFQIDTKSLAKITVIREKKVFGFAIPFTVYVGGYNLGILKNDSVLECNIPYGEYKVYFKSTEKDVIVDVLLNKNKKEVIIKVVPKMGIIAARPYVKEVIYK